MKANMTVPLLALALLAAGLTPGRLEAKRRYVERPFTFSVFPPLSTNGLDAGRVRTNFGLNLIGGYVGELAGCEIGSVFNIEEANAAGCQVAGVFNIVGGDFTGVQTAGVFNITGNDLHVLQVAGVFNLTGRDVFGAQVGPVNIGLGCYGAQVGVVNICGDGAGAQVGVANIGERFDGVQVGVTNIGERVAGLRVGVVNVGHRLDGFSLGVVNIADRSDGEALGLVSIIGDGQNHFCIYAEELTLLNVGFKLGSRHVYNVFSAGMTPRGDSTRWSFGLGLGGHIPIDRFFVDIDAVGSNIRRKEPWESDYPTMLGKLRIAGGWQITNALALTFGPTLSVLWSQQPPDGMMPPYGIKLFDLHSDENWVRAWPGFTVGLQLL